MSVKILIIRISLTVFMLFFAHSFLAAQEVKALAKASDKAIIILSTDTVSEMQTARKIIENNGAKIQSIFPPSVFIGEIPQNIADELKKLGFIKEISYTRVDILKYESYEASVKDAILLWNERFDKQIQAETRQAMPELEDKKEPFKDDLIMPDFTKTKEERLKEKEEYRKHWEQKREEFLRQEQEKKNKRPPGSARLASSEVKTSAFGKTSGAGYIDTSLYMAGDIAVGVFFEPGTNGNWTTQTINETFSAITQALGQFIADEPNAHISLTFIKEVDEAGIPKSLPSSEGDYVNDLRNTYNTHWAYMITVYYGDGRASANYFGPSLRLYSDDLRDGYAVRHETMHIFGAMDQYHPDAGQSPVDRWGYLNAVNANSEYNDGQGYFQGKGEGLADIMIRGGPIGVYSRGQVGWRDSDGDGILEPLDTFPDTLIVNKTGSNPITYTGRAQDKPLLCELGDYGYGSVTLNTIKSVEYRINNGAWCEAAPSADGAYDSAEEEFSFTTPSFSNGDYTIEIRAINSVNNAETSYVKDKLKIRESSVTNVRPFTAFSITPLKGSIETNFSFDADSSSDMGDVSSNLYARWDFENDGVFDTAFSQNKGLTHKYSTPGLKTVKLEVRDSLGLTNTITKQIEVTAYNLSPQAFFTVTPENAHSDSKAFTVNFNAQDSYDAEDARSGLKFRWDFEDDGTWDTEYLDKHTLQHSYQLPVSSFSVSTSIYDTPDTARDVCVLGNYAYVADESSGLQIIDITDPLSPEYAGTAATPGSALGVDSFFGIYAYVADALSGLQIIDLVSYPSGPIIVGNYDTPGQANSVYVSGNYAYVADALSGLQIIDIVNPSSPKLVSSYDTPNWAWYVYVSGNYAYVADYHSGLQIIDIANPSSPKLAGSYDTPGQAYSVYVSGNYAYIADGDSGLQVIDITNLSNPELAGSYDTPGSAFGVYVLGSYAYVADRSSGLYIFELLEKSNETADPESKHWRAKLEVKDKNGNASCVTRDVWDVTYNHPPIIEGIERINVYLNAKLAGTYNMYGGHAYNIYVLGNYAYVGSISGLGIVDITSTSSPKYTGFCDTPSTPYDVYVLGNYAYVADYFSLQIIDIANPANPKIVGNYDTPGRAYGVYVLGNYAYVADYNGLQIIDITNPSVPKLAGSYGPLRDAENVYVLGNYAYVANGNLGLEIIDISNPSSPKFAGWCDTPGSASEVYISGNYAYVADYFSLQIIDIVNPANPKIVGSYDMAGYANSVYVLANYAYVADPSFGLQIIDISNPSNPKYAGSYDTSNYVSSVFVLGKYAYIADAEGISILQIEMGEGIRPIGGFDSDKNTLWDGLLEYRWDFDNDGTWDTKFFEEDDYFLSDNKYSTIVCEIRDRFGATNRVSLIPKDTTPPATVAFGIDGLWHNNAVTVTLDASDEESGIDRIFYSTDGSIPSIPYTVPFVLSNEGIHAIKYYSIDKAGNKEEIKTAGSQVMIDRTPPVCSILINNDAKYVNFASVTLNLLSYDALSGLSQMQLSNDGITYSEPERYGSNSRVIKPWILASGSGTKTVYVKLQDAAGNWSQAYSDSIFKNPSFIYGDINEDGLITSGDVLLALKASLGLTTLTPELMRAADVDGSGITTSGDALLILQYSVHIITSFPVEKKLPSRQPFRRYLQSNRSR